MLNVNNWKKWCIFQKSRLQEGHFFSKLSDNPAFEEPSDIEEVGSGSKGAHQISSKIEDSILSTKTHSAKLEKDSLILSPSHSDQEQFETKTAYKGNSLGQFKTYIWIFYHKTMWPWPNPKIWYNNVQVNKNLNVHVVAYFIRVFNFSSIYTHSCMKMSHLFELNITPLFWRFLSTKFWRRIRYSHNQGQKYWRKWFSRFRHRRTLCFALRFRHQNFMEGMENYSSHLHKIEQRPSYKVEVATKSLDTFVQWRICQELY